jgi:translation elongation factor EF-Tu-like GTPase
MSRTSIRARIYLQPTETGGRSGPVLTGYRSLLRFEGTEVDFGFELELDPSLGSKGLAPGHSGEAKLSFWSEQLPILMCSKRFELREGTRVIGYGNVL